MPDVVKGEKTLDRRQVRQDRHRQSGRRALWRRRRRDDEDAEALRHPAAEVRRGQRTSRRPSSSSIPAMPSSASSRCRSSPARPSGSRWLVPQNLYQPIRQDAVLLKKGADNRGGDGVHRIPQGPGGPRDHREVRLRARRQLADPPWRDCRPTSGTPIRLTIELAAITTIILLIVGTPIAWWLARSRALVEGAVAAVVALPLVLPPTVLGFYLLVALGPNGPGGLIAGLWGARTLAFTFEGLVIGSVIYSMPFVVQPIRNAFEAMGERPLEVAATLRASPARRLLDGRGAAGAARVSDRRRARLRPHGRRVRRGADDRRQHPGQDQGAVGRDLRFRRDARSGARRTSSPPAWWSSPSPSSSP